MQRTLLELPSRLIPFRIQSMSDAINSTANRPRLLFHLSLRVDNTRLETVS
jgi:hypothetical protein